MPFGSKYITVSSMPEVLKRDERGNCFTLFYRENEELGKKMEKELKERGKWKGIYEVMIALEKV